MKNILNLIITVLSVNTYASQYMAASSCEKLSGIYDCGDAQISKIKYHFGAKFPIIELTKFEANFNGSLNGIFVLDGKTRTNKANIDIVSKCKNKTATITATLPDNNIYEGTITIERQKLTITNSIDPEPYTCTKL